MAWIEDTGKRGRSAKHYHDDADPAKKQAVFTIHDQHYHDGSTWQDCDENIADDTSVSGYVASLTKTRHIMRFANTGGRKWWPRREFPNEYVTFGRPQYFSNTWKNMSTGTMARNGNVLTFTTADYVIRLTATWRGVKLDYILNNANAYTRVRFAAALTGLTWNGWQLIGADGKAAGYISDTTAADANGAVVPVTATNAGGYIEFTVDTTGAAFPVTVDPSPLTQVGDTADAELVGYHASSYDTARSTATQSWPNSTALVVGQESYLDAYFYVYRSLVKFDSSSLPDDCTITQVNLLLTATGDSSGTNFDIAIVKQDWSGVDPITSGNRDAAYDACLSGTLDDNIWRNTNGMSVNTEYASGNLAVAYPSKVGNTYYSLISNLDIAGTAPSGTNYQYVTLAAANHGTAAYRPKLVIAYTEAGGGAVRLAACRSLLGVGL